MLSTSNQLVFDAIDYGFRWVGDWYEFDAKAAGMAARKARDAKARELRKQGKMVKNFTLGMQLRSKGGIGSGRPHIEVYAQCYGINILD